MKQGRRGRGYRSHSIESSGSMPPFGGIPLDSLDPTLDIASESSRRASIFDHSLGIPDSWCSRSAVEPFRRASHRPLETIVGAYLGLRSKEVAVAVRLSARWARLFRRVTLRHCIGGEFGESDL